MKVLVIGDVVGEPGRNILTKFLSNRKDNYDFIIVNGENAAGGFGITEKIAKKFFHEGANVITTGNHIWDKRDSYEYLDIEKRIVRPANYPDSSPGNGYVIVEDKNGTKICVINIQGRIFMPPINSPFEKIDEILENLDKDIKHIIVDFHCEATSEKQAMGWYLDGKVSLIFGTHTHVQTADERILNDGTAYITDVGLTGCFDGILGFKREIAIQKFIDLMPSRFQISHLNPGISGIVVEMDEEGKSTSIERIRLTYNDLNGGK